MRECELLAGCIFFNDHMANMPANAELMKKGFCLGEYTQCARFRVFAALGREKVPQDLFPSDPNRAMKIISKA